MLICQIKFTSLLHHNHLMILFTSKTSSAEKSGSNRKEDLAIIFFCRKAHDKVHFSNVHFNRRPSCLTSDQPSCGLLLVRVWNDNFQSVKIIQRKTFGEFLTQAVLEDHKRNDKRIAFRLFCG